MSLTKVKGSVDPLAQTLASEEGANAVHCQNGASVQLNLDNINAGMTSLSHNITTNREDIAALDTRLDTNDALGFQKAGRLVKQGEKFVPVLLADGNMSTGGATLTNYRCHMVSSGPGVVNVELDDVTDLSLGGGDMIHITPATAGVFFYLASGSTTGFTIRAVDLAGQAGNGYFHFAVMRLRDRNFSTMEETPVRAKDDAMVIPSDEPCIDKESAPVLPVSIRTRGFE